MKFLKIAPIIAEIVFLVEIHPNNRSITKISGESQGRITNISTNQGRFRSDTRYQPE